MPMTVKCPTCRKDTAWESNPYRPFCSERCKLVDLGAWADERYRIPGEELEVSFDDDDDDNPKLH